MLAFVPSALPLVMPVIVTGGVLLLLSRLLRGMFRVIFVLIALLFAALLAQEMLGQRPRQPRLVLFDSTAAIAYKEASLQLRPGEKAAVPEVVLTEIDGGLPPAGAVVVPNSPDLLTIQAVRRRLREVGAPEGSHTDNDAVIGATTMAGALPLVTEDGCLFVAMRSLGVEVRSYRRDPATIACSYQP